MPGPEFSIRFTPEPVIVLFIYASMMQAPLESQYVYKRYSEEKGLVYDSGKASSSCIDHLNSTDKKIQDEVQHLASIFSIGQTLLWSLGSVLSCLYYGVISDKIGRRTIIMITCFGGIIQACFTLAIIKLNLPLYIFFASSFLLGLGGGYNGLYMMVYAYIADCTDAEALPMRLAIVESTNFIASCASSFSTGLFIERLGFLVPEIVVFSFNVAAFLYVLLVLKESLNIKKRHKNNEAVKGKCCEQPKILYKMLSKERPRKKFLYLSLAIIVFGQCLANGPLSSWTLYFMNRPFCWPPLQTGYYLGTYMLTMGVGTYIGLKFLLKVFPKYLVATLSPLFNIAGFIVTSFARNKAMAYSALALRAFSSLHTPVFRATISSLVNPTEQGFIFSVSSILETFFVGVGGFVFNVSYTNLNKIGEDYQVFTIIEVLLFVQVIMTIVFWIFWRKIRFDGYTPISDQENEESNNSQINNNRPVSRNDYNYKTEKAVVLQAETAWN